MHIEDVDALTSWLIRELKPICDAEPPVLAKYVLSLIRKPDKTDEEIMEFCSAQLEVFLQANTKRFVEKMFSAIKDGSYLEVERAKIEDEKPPAREEKRAEETKPTTSKEAKSEARKAPPFPPRKEESIKKDESRIVRKRISPPADAKKETVERAVNRDRRRSRSPNRRDRRRSPARRHRRSRSRSGDRDHRKSDDTRKRRRCRDYDEKGVCTRGDLCQFDHGPDPVVFDREVMDMMPIGSLGPKGAPAPNLSVPPPGYNPINPPPPGVENIYNAPPPSSGAVEGYNPEAPALTSANYTIPPPPLPSQMNQAPWRPLYTVNSANLAVPVYDPNLGVPVDPTSGPAPVHGVMRGGAVMRGRGRGRGGSGHTGAPHFNRNIGDGKTIQVSRIPQEDNTITKLNEHFSQFGNIVNIQVRFDGDPSLALITFTCKAEATAALKSPSPVLNNRFIRTEFYRPPETENSSPSAKETSLSSGVVVTKPTAPAQPTEKIAVGESKFVNSNFSAREKAKTKKKELQTKAKGILDAQRKQMTLLDSLLKQQKNILGKLKEEIVDVEAKKRLKELAKATNEQITVARTMNASLSRQLEENRKAMKEIEDTLSSTVAQKSPTEEAPNGVTAGTRKRGAPAAQSLSSKKKLVGSSLLVSGFTMDIEHQVTEAMESHGELLDVEIQPGTGSDVSAIYIYKDRSDAEKALENPPQINGKILKVVPKTDVSEAKKTCLHQQPVETV